MTVKSLLNGRKRSEFDPEIYLRLGNLLKQSGRTKQARKTYQQALIYPATQSKAGQDLEQVK